MSMADTALASIPIDKGVLIFRRKDSSCWYMSVSGGGKRRIQSLHTRDRNYALVIAHQRAEELLSFKNQVILARDPLIDRLFDGYKRRVDLRNTPASRRLQLDNLSRICTYLRERNGVERPLRLSDFSPDALDMYIQQRRALGIKPSTINRERSTWYACFRFAARRRLIRMNPIEVVEPLPEIRRRLPPTITNDQATALLLEAAKDVPCHGRGNKGRGNERPRLTPLHDIIVIALNTGARLGEILYLEWSDIRFQEGQVCILNKDIHQLKNREDRIVKANPLVLNMLTRRWERRDEEVTWVFPSAEETVLDRRNVLREFKLVAARATIPWANFLILRHTALTALAKTGIPPFVLRELAGHASLRTTERYYIGNVGSCDWSPPPIGMPQF
jgi:integrase